MGAFGFFRFAVSHTCDITSGSVSWTSICELVYFKVIKDWKCLCFATSSSDMASRIFDDDFSDATSTASTIRNESSKEISEQDGEFSDMEEETEHTVDPY